MKRETLAELVARTVVEFEKREAQVQQQPNKPKRRKSKAA